MNYSLFIAHSLNPLIWLTISGSVISGVWLLTYGVPLSIVWMPVLLLMFGHMVFPFLMLPVQLIMVLLAGRPMLAQLLSFAWLAALLSLTSMLVFALTRGAAAPLVLWVVFTVCAGVAPWATFCLKDRGNLMFITLVWILLMASAAAALVHVFIGLKILPYGFVVWGMMMALLGLQAVCEARLNRPRV